MFGLGKKDKQTDATDIFNRLGLGLKKTRSNLFSGLDTYFKTTTNIDAGLLEEIESRLIMADVGIEAITAHALFSFASHRSPRPKLFEYSITPHFRTPPGSPI